jgi:hypothetical protein
MIICETSLAIAERVGWFLHNGGWDGPDLWTIMKDGVYHSDANGYPDYAGDLNAIQEVLLTLTYDELEAFDNILDGICYRDREHTVGGVPISVMRTVASAAQRAEALIELWKL